jgi:RNA polymerase sigma-70 factor (ECF subfamily)
MSNYDRYHDWRLAPAWLEGREVIVVFRAPGDTRPGYFIELYFERDKIRSIRDFRYVPYVMQDAVAVLA